MIKYKCLEKPTKKQLKIIKNMEKYCPKASDINTKEDASKYIDSNKDLYLMSIDTYTYFKMEEYGY